MARYFTVQLTVLTVLVTNSYGKIDYFGNTACSGVNSRCPYHNLRCNNNEGLVITRAKYGYVELQSRRKTCCRYNKSDCLVDFTASDMSDIYKCSGLSGCPIPSPTRGVASHCNDNKNYAYSWIEHGCSNASVIINLSDSTIQEKNKNQVIINYDKYKNGKNIGADGVDKTDPDEGELGVGCLCKVSFETYIFLYQTNDGRQPINVGDYTAKSDTWYKIDDEIDEIILPKHNVNITLRAKNEYRKIQTVLCGCYDSNGIDVDDTKREYLKEANQTEVENFFIPQEDIGSGKNSEEGGNDKTVFIVGIVLGSLCLIIVIITITIILIRTWKRKKTNTGMKTSTPVSDPSSVHDQHYYHYVEPNHVGIIGEVVTGRQADNYNHIGDIKTSNHGDTYNHIGYIKTDSQANTYNHIGDMNTSNPGVIGYIKTGDQLDTYNHIGDIKTSNPGDTYNHIGDFKTTAPTDTSNYNHIADIKITNQADTSNYNHIGDVKTSSQADSSNYSHIGDIKITNQADTSNYDHIGDNKTTNQ
ncbi:uncharacterized protein LOC126810243 [Patella vulgata]|uniref:uncharacterized protein LOC126810243 n=1 Tax=Patella vulgata TaxID=6465 RepID=UPI0024A9CDFB|nr:uncharacterized protein LOC126810243 [Patella vulgata]